MNFLANLKVFVHGTWPKMYERMEKRYQKKAKKSHVEYFHAHVGGVFAEFDAAMKEAGVDYWLTFGTLLGAIREHGLIKHDDDLDVAVYYDADNELMDTCLRRHGFEKVRQIDVYSKRGDMGGEFTYSKNGIGIDIFRGRLNGDGTVTLNDFWDSRVGDGFRLYTQARAVTMPFSGLMDYEFLGCTAKVPANYHDYLSIHYGPNYMTPDPSWTAAAPPDTRVLEDAVGIRFL